MPKLPGTKVATAALACLATREGPVSFNFCSVYMGRQLLLGQKRYATHRGI